MAELQWIKLKLIFFDDEKIKIIESLPNGDSLIVIWIKLLVQAGKCNAGGYIYLTERIPLDIERISVIFNRPLSTVRLALKTFQKLGMISIDQDNLINIIEWQAEQSLDSTEKWREKSRLRVQKFRENQRKRISCNVTGNVTVTAVTPEDIRSKDINIKEREKEKEVSPLSAEEHYRRCYEKRFAIQPRISPKEKAVLEELSAQVEGKDLLQLISQYFRSEDPAITESSYAISFFASSGIFNKLKAKLASQRADETEKAERRDLEQKAKADLVDPDELRKYIQGLQ